MYSFIKMGNLLKRFSTNSDHNLHLKKKVKEKKVK